MPTFTMPVLAADPPGLTLVTTMPVSLLPSTEMPSGNLSFTITMASCDMVSNCQQAVELVCACVCVCGCLKS